MRRFGLLLAGFVALMGSVAIASSGGGTQVQARWVITDLGTLGGQESEAVAINDRGQVVGWSLMENMGKDRFGYPVEHAFLWQTGRMTDLGTLGTRSSEPVAINNRGQIIGWSGNYNWSPGDGVTHAFLWQAGKMTSLTPRGAIGSWATAINARGWIIGTSDAKRSVYSAVLWRDGKVTMLRPPRRGWEVGAIAINDRGQVVGEVCNSKDPTHTTGHSCHAFLWQTGKTQDLGAPLGAPVSLASDINEPGQVIGDSFARRDNVTDDPYPSRAFLWEKSRAIGLGAPSGAFRYSHAVAINDHGQIIGTNASYHDSSDGSRSFLWQKGKMIDLGTLPGYRATLVNDINERGQVVGESYLRYQDYEWRKPRAFIWENGKMTALGTLPGGKECGAVAVNDRSQIVGWCAITTKGEYPDRHAVLWTLKRG